MKFMFLVQGEGRGHMTQAIELSKILTKNGHEIVYTFIGQSSRRQVPDYFYKKIDSTVEALHSPNFVLDKNNKSLKVFKSITYNTRYLATYKKSLETIHARVISTKPDVLVNFYDFLGGFYFRFYNPSDVKHVCIGRQFLTNHPHYPFAEGRPLEKRLFLINNAITSQRCDKYLALSFRPYTPEKHKNTVVVPPLLKQEVKEGNATREDFILGYMVNDGYAEEIIAWHEQNPQYEVHCFWDRKNMPETYCPHENLTFHQINNHLFNQMMRRCKAYISTAGFESICEAMYLQKPVMMVPVAGQYEQACNAIEGELVGAGIRAEHFDISRIIAYLDKYQPSDQFHKWVSCTEEIILRELTNF